MNTEQYNIDKRQKLRKQSWRENVIRTWSVNIKKKEGRKGGRERKDGRTTPLTHSHWHTLVSPGASDVIVADVLCNTDWQESRSGVWCVCVYLCVCLCMCLCACVPTCASAILKPKCSTKQRVNPLCFAGHDSGRILNQWARAHKGRRAATHKPTRRVCVRTHTQDTDLSATTNHRRIVLFFRVSKLPLPLSTLLQ